MTNTASSKYKKRPSPRKIIGCVLLLFVIGWGAFHYSVSSMVEQRFSGPLFELPTVVYARPMTLNIDLAVKQQDVVDELKTLNYQLVDKPAHSGEYSVAGNSITLVRRPFEFADGFRDVQRVKLTFSRSRIQSMIDVDSGMGLGLFQLEPKMMGLMGEDGNQHRLYQSWKAMPEGVVKALLLTEDRAFFEHDGVSVTAIARAFFTNVKAGRTVQGGSTLTQQLTKNLFLSSERSWSRKIREAYMALLIDSRYTKDDILDGYVNQIYLGQQGKDAIHGFELGAQFYFNRPLQELRIDQQALLVALIKGPSYYNPWRFPERAKTRRNTVLKLLADDGHLEPKEYETAIARELDIQVRGHVSLSRPAYFDLVSDELEVALPGRNIKGARIFTTLDPLSQQKAESSLLSTLPSLDAKAGVELEAAFISIDYSNGAIRAIVGNRNPNFAGFNYARHGKRQVGSIIKPAVTMAALRSPEKYNLASALDDKPLTVKQPNGDNWQPRNYSREFWGEASLYTSLAHSLNVPMVNLGMQLGLENVADFIEQLSGQHSEIKPLPSMVLGAFEMTPIEVSGLYQPIVNHGARQQAYLISEVVDAKSKVLYQHKLNPEQVAPEQAADLTVAAMQGAVSEGTAKSLGSVGVKYKLAGKTGTTNSNRDSWYVGVDGRELVTVWLGRGDNGNTKLTGATGALSVYRHYITQRGAIAISPHYADDIEMVNFSRRGQGKLAASCGRGSVTLPVWGASQFTSSGCVGDEITNFFKSLFN
ncbi:penicillin-binding protein 1B [Vibrio breoganii]|uniref:penicillin-binding protein 1B n=1 Tax=Vibrio breoganii TaxID=553239 RepID=UPI001F524476|nr:penicillin-binding protein 1B [Vibrio breoganii]